MSWGFIFEFSKYLGIALIVVSIIVRYFKKFPLHIPVIVGLLLLISFGGSFALSIAQMTNEEVAVRFGIDASAIGQLRFSNVLLQYLAMITVSVVYIAAFFEGLTRLIRFSYKQLKKRKKQRH